MISHEVLAAPHVPRPLPTGKCAVYVFYLSHVYGRQCPAGPNRALKVGKVGPNTNARFQSQHYSAGSAQSTLAGTLMKAVILWPYLGIDILRELDVRPWILRNTERDHFYLDGTCTDLVAELERYLRARLAPVFEGG